jgi:hypothetical protein
MLDGIEMSSAAKQDFEKLNLDERILLSIAFDQAISHPELATRYPPRLGRFSGGYATIQRVRIGLCEFVIAEVISSGKIGLLNFAFTQDLERLAAE